MKKLSLTLVLALVIGFIVPATACAKKKAECNYYDISITYSETENTISGTVDFEYLNTTENEISELKFNLFGNAFREGATYSPVSKTYESRAYYDGLSYGEMTVTNVENCAEWKIAGEDENVLCVTLENAVYPDERAQIKITYTLKLAKVNHRTGVTQKAVNLGNFYPVLCVYGESGFIECPYYSNGDPFLSDCSNYRVKLNLPREYVAASSGKVENEEEAEGLKCVTYSLENARDFALVISKNFSVVSENVNGVEVSYYYYDDEKAQESLKAACQSLQYFDKSFGKYVYPTLSVVQTGFCYGGMEYPALTMISDELDGADFIYTIVHENAHQWWYAMVGSDQINCAWQDEGLAEYSAMMFFENTPEYGFTKTGMVGSATKAYRAYFSVYNQIFGGADTSMNRNLKDYSSDYEYTNIAYNKGLILFDTLRNSLGNDKFMSSLKKYYNDNLYEIATYGDICAAFSNSGAEAEKFFSSFVEGKIVI